MKSIIYECFALYNNDNHSAICEGQLYVKVAVLLTCGKHAHDRIISLKGEEVWDNKTSVTPPLFIEVIVPSQKSGRSKIC